MLAELYVENFALIKALRTEFSEHLNIISGETGAGKSLLTDALGLLLGGRGEKDLIRSGAKKTLVEAVFHGPFSDAVKQILDGDETEEDILILSREIHLTGKSICRLNRRQIPLSLLKKLTPQLLLIHDQFAHLDLMKDQYQLELLDRYGGAAIRQRKERMRAAFQHWKQEKDALAAFEQEEERQDQEVDFLRFQQTELANAALKPGEREALEREIAILENSQEIYEAAAEAYKAVYGGERDAASDLIYHALTAVEKIIPYDNAFAEIKERLNDIFYNLEDIGGTLQHYGETLERDPRHLEEMEERLSRIKTLEKKYHKNTEELISLLETINERLDRIENMSQYLEEQRKKESAAKALAFTEAGELTKARKETACSLATAIIAQLRELLLPDVRFAVDIREGELSWIGADKVEFMISLNPGETVKPLKRVASGGEMSRIILGMQVILAGLGQVGTIVFDEIDSGLGGKAAAKAGEKLQALATDTQVIAVTHSPLVAAVADCHFYIEKKVTDEKTSISLTHLTGDAVKQEIARMITGDSENEITLHQAEELLLQAQSKRNPSTG